MKRLVRALLLRVCPNAPYWLFFLLGFVVGCSASVPKETTTPVDVEFDMPLGVCALDCQSKRAASYRKVVRSPLPSIQEREGEASWGQLGFIYDPQWVKTGEGDIDVGALREASDLLHGLEEDMATLRQTWEKQDQAKKAASERPRNPTAAEVLKARTVKY